MKTIQDILGYSDIRHMPECIMGILFGDKERRNVIFMSIRGIMGKVFHGDVLERLITSGADIKTVSEILGHSTPAITLGIYTHTNEALKKKCANMLKYI